MWEPSEEEVAEVIAELIGNGFFDLVSSPNGDVLYKLSENAQEISPVLYDLMIKSMNEELMEYIELGYIDYRFSDDLELEYRWTPAGIEHMESQGYTFEDE